MSSVPFEISQRVYRHPGGAIFIVMVGICTVILSCGCNRHNGGQAMPGVTVASKSAPAAVATGEQAPKLVSILRITDRQGSQVDLFAARLDYTDYSVVYRPDHDSDGVRIYQGDAIVKVDWDKIVRLEINSETAGLPRYRMRGQLQLKSGSTKEVILEQAGKVSGLTERGGYFIYFVNIKSIVPIQTSFIKRGLFDPSATNSNVANYNQSFAQLIVVDRKGTITELRNPDLDYTVYSFIYHPEHETGGLRMKFDQAQGVVTVPWGLIRAAQRNRSETSSETRAEHCKWSIEFRDTPTTAVILESDSKQGLTGQCDLGKFSIRLIDIEALLPVHDAAGELSQQEVARKLSAEIKSRLEKVVLKSSPNTSSKATPSVLVEPKKPRRLNTLPESNEPEIRPDPKTAKPKPESRKTSPKSETAAPAKSNPEKVALSKLTLAKQLLDQNKSAAKRRLEELVKDFGETAAGKEAAELLKSL